MYGKFTISTKTFFKNMARIYAKTPRDRMAMTPKARPLYSKGPVAIGNNAWLGNNVFVCV